MRCEAAQIRAKPDGTNRDYCLCHAAHGDYTFADAWVEFLVNKIVTDAGFRRNPIHKL